MNYKHLINLVAREIIFLMSYIDFFVKMTENEKKDLLENFQNIKNILEQHKENTKEDFIIEVK